MTQPGDLWVLGKHRLFCDDATRAEDIARLFDGGEADQLLTDPHYGVDYGEKVEYRKGHGVPQRADGTIRSDESDRDWRRFFASFLLLAPLRQPNTAFIVMSGQNLHALRGAMDDAGLTWCDYVIWAKN